MPPASADGIVITPSHNPPQDGGFKYNPPNGGPADTDANKWIAGRANELLAAKLDGVQRRSLDSVRGDLESYDFLGRYVDDLPSVVNMAAIRAAGVRIGADPMGGASVAYWGAIAERHRLDLTVVNPNVDPQFGFMTLDWDGKIRMDCSSPYAMASLVQRRNEYQIATGNDADADRHGIVTADAGLMNPNHYLAVAIGYLYANRPDWPQDTGIGKTAVSSSMIDFVAHDLGGGWSRPPSGSSGSCRASSTARSRSAARRARARRSSAPTARCGPPTRTVSSSACSPRRSWRSPGRRPASATGS